MIECPSDGCIGCEACALICPNLAIEMVEIEENKRIKINVDQKSFEVPANITVKEALKISGFQIGKFPEDDLFMPCESGGCWACMIEINGELKRACISKVQDGAKILTKKQKTPYRIITGFMPHTVGGVGTPWWIKGKGYIEVACFAAGCNLRCPQCQNWSTAYLNKGQPLTPQDAAKIMTMLRKRYKVDRIAISGGEPTLNPEWLIEYIKELKKLNPDPQARLHVDTNGTVLTPEYIDELIEAGVTDIGIDIKALNVETYMHITGIKQRDLAEKYKENSFKAAEYILDHHPQVFLGIGIPYNRSLITLEEIEEMAKRILKISKDVQICVLDYRGEFRRRWLLRPSYKEMLKVHEMLRDLGFKNVISQTYLGHIGPDGKPI